MAFSQYFLVFWPEEKKYSCVGRACIVDENLRKEKDENLIERGEMKITFNRKVYTGKIIFCGSSPKAVNKYQKKFDRNEAPLNNPTEPAMEPQSKTRKMKCNDIEATISEVIETVEMRNLSENVNISQNTDERVDSNNLEKKTKKLEKKLKKANENIANIKLELEQEKTLREKYKSKCKHLREKLQTFQQDETVMVDIGNGVKLNAALLDRAKIFSSSPAVLGRNVFRLAFTESEIVGRSLFGRICNANKHLPAKPSVDSSKRDAVIRYCISVVEEECVHSGLKFDKVSVRSKISKSLGEYIREITHKCHQLEHDSEADA